MIRDFFDTIIQHITDHDSFLGCRRNIDIVDADAIPDHDLTALQGMNDFRGNRGTRDQNSVRIPGNFNDFFFRFGLPHDKFRTNLG